jgi:hypothetical protein
MNPARNQSNNPKVSIMALENYKYKEEESKGDWH